MHLTKRARRILLALLLLAVAAAVSAPRPAAAATGPCSTPTVPVSTATQLHAALAAAAPGDVIQLDPGTYTGLFVASTPGTSSAPIWLCGGSGVVLDGGSITGGYALHLNGASWWRVDGLEVTNALKGVMVDAAANVVVQNNLVHGLGDEGIHLRKNTVDSLVTGNTIHDTGNRRSTFGEGIYVGSSDANWGILTGGQPDYSDRNVVSGNVIYDVTAENVDIKEGTSGGQLLNNIFDGGGQVPDADSWVDVKGNGWLIAGNVGTHSALNGYETHHRDMRKKNLGNWGLNNRFEGNTADVQPPTGTPDPPRAFYIHDWQTTGNVVTCDNVWLNVPNFSNGLACTP